MRHKKVGKDALRKQIMEAALGEMREKGIHGAGLKKLALAAKMSQGSFYSYFKSKGHLIQEAIAVRLSVWFIVLGKLPLQIEPAQNGQANESRIIATQQCGVDSLPSFGADSSAFCENILFGLSGQPCQNAARIRRQTRSRTREGWKTLDPPASTASKGPTVALLRG